MDGIKEKAEKYFGVDIDQIQRQWDLTHSYDKRNIEKEYVDIYKKLKNVSDKK